MSILQTKTNKDRKQHMPRVKVRRAPEITLPKEAWQKLGAADGDYIDVDIVEEGVFLRPLSEREKAWERITEAGKSVRYKGPEPRPSPEEEEQWIAEEIKAMRKEEYEKSHH